jgi:hypothetical protein
MEMVFQIGGGVLLSANTVMLGRLIYQAGKLVQRVDDHEKDLKRHDQELRDLRQRK